ncbi:MAG: BCCT family transporter [Desulforhopalus sp.]|nr:BCCT family transporter [Desulforhopalus sp.]
MRVSKDDRNGQATMKILGANIDRVVFFGSSALVLPFILLGALAPELLTQGGNAILSWVIKTWGWLYLSSVSIFVLAGLALALSPLGSIRLGRDDEKPEFSRLSWFAMLFSAGMGIGLVFWSIAEPLYHFSGPPTGEAKTAESARLAFSIFFHHWGLHAWGTYVAVGLPIAYFQFRKGTTGTVSSCLMPLFRKFSAKGEVEQPSALANCAGNIVDILAVWATVLGVVTSLGLGALQIASGLSITFGIPGGSFTTGGVIVVITLLFVMSALSGVKRGIKYLSLTNVAIMVILFCFFLVFGPLSYLSHTFFTALGDYVANIIPLSTTLTLFDNSKWTGSWTIFYWAWWIAWAPFVGAFIANISRGRTIREFILVVMIVPAVFSFLFSTALGGTAIHMQLFENIPLVETIATSIEATLFETLRHLPLYTVTAIVTNILIASFFITSADSATFVISRFSQGRNSTQEPVVSRPLVIFWGVTLGGLALVLVFSGGLKALQTASIIGALPFVLVIYLLLISLIRELIAEKYGSNR